MKHSLYYQALATALALAVHVSDARAAEPPPDKWQFSVTPYLFLPNVNGTLNYQLPPGDPEAEYGPNNYLEALNYTLMVGGEVRKGDWGLLADFIVMDFVNEKNRVKSISGPSGTVYPIDAGSDGSLHGLVWQLAGFHKLAKTRKISIDVLAGVRYLKIDTSLSWTLTGPAGTFPQTGDASRNTVLTDAIVGVRGRIQLGEGQWFIPYYLDIGVGAASSTWQGLAGVGYALKWGDLLLSYRSLFVDQGHEKFVQDLRFSGPTIGATFHF
jgi:hypothetical protein